MKQARKFVTSLLAVLLLFSTLTAVSYTHLDADCAGGRRLRHADPWHADRCDGAGAGSGGADVSAGHCQAHGCLTAARKNRFPNMESGFFNGLLLARCSPVKRKDRLKL